METDSGEDTLQQSSEKCESLKPPEPSLTNGEEEKQGKMLKSCDKVDNNEDRAHDITESSEEFLVKSAISEPQLKLDFSLSNKNESLMKIKPPVPKETPRDQFSSSLESELSSDGRTFKVCFIIL